MIKLFKDSLPDGRITHFINELNSNKRIGVINWWHIQELNPIPTISELKEFLESVDITIFVNIEILLGPAGQQYLDDALNLLPNYNVSYITFSEEPAMLNWQAHRTFSKPWFLKSPCYIPPGFVPDLDYRDKPYDFNLLLGRKKPERDILWHALHKNKNVYATYYGDPKQKHLSANCYDETTITEFLVTQDVENLAQGLKTMSKQPEFKNAFLSHIVPVSIYNNTHMDIIVETQTTRPELMFFTEKTGKALATGRPWLMTLGGDTCEYLGKHGFSTMPLSYCGYFETPVHQLSTVLEAIDYLSTEPGAMQDFYVQTRLAREYNMNQYATLIDQFDTNLEQWLHDQINNY